MKALSLTKITLGDLLAVVPNNEFVSVYISDDNDKVGRP